MSRWLGLLRTAVAVVVFECGETSVIASCSGEVSMWFFHAAEFDPLGIVTESVKHFESSGWLLLLLLPLSWLFMAPVIGGWVRSLLSPPSESGGVTGGNEFAKAGGVPLVLGGASNFTGGALSVGESGSAGRPFGRPLSSSSLEGEELQLRSRGRKVWGGRGAPQFCPPAVVEGVGLSGEEEEEEEGRESVPTGG